jgi:hypothetical protein
MGLSTITWTVDPRHLRSSAFLSSTDIPSFFDIVPLNWREIKDSRQWHLKSLPVSCIIRRTEENGRPWAAFPFVYGLFVDSTYRDGNEADVLYKKPKSLKTVWILIDALRHFIGKMLQNTPYFGIFTS